jgi:poly(hydroxyalkanoate) depolymerase family esterase
MNPLFQRLMHKATRLTGQGDLQAATAAIQAALAGKDDAAAANDSSAPDVIDVAARELHERSASAPAAEPAPAATPAQFIAGHYTGPEGSRDYKLYIPPQAAQAAPAALVVMLHGCTQNPDDFAAGTRMNEAAAAQGFFVLYPAQSRQANPQGCWNWFKHTHQARGRGEPALLASMTRQVMGEHGIDPARVFVAGLSAGGAMAAILGEAYPDLYAAVGVHSGLAAGVARDLPSALNAMKAGGAVRRAQPTGVPTIVFHGDADGHPGNGDSVVAAAAGTADAGPAEKQRADGGHQYTRRVHRAPTGAPTEHWVVHGSAHAWSGGSPRGSYTDPKGPDATAEMVRFFMANGRSHRPPEAA